MKYRRKIIYPSIEEIKFIAHELACELMTKTEPIPDFSTRFPNKLESCLVAPQQTFNQKDLYPTLIDKASILLYLLIKNHPFQNGNKRVAIMSLLYFLTVNKKWLRVDTRVLYNFARWIAESNADLKDAVVDAIKIFLTKNLEARL